MKISWENVTTRVIFSAATITHAPLTLRARVKQTDASAAKIVQKYHATTTTFAR